MTDKHEHRRDSEQEEYEHQRDTDNIPNWLKWSFVAINRVGFPIVAFFFMWYVATVSQKKLSDSLERQSLSLETLIVTLNGYHAESKEWRAQMLEQIHDIRMRVGK